MPDAGASRDLGHRHLGVGVGECGAGGREDLVAVALGVGSSRRRARDWCAGIGLPSGEAIRYPLQ